MLDGVQLLAKEGMTVEEAEQRVQQVSKDMQAIIGRSLSHTRFEVWNPFLRIGMAHMPYLSPVTVSGCIWLAMHND